MRGKSRCTEPSELYLRPGRPRTGVVAFLLIGFLETLEDDEMLRLENNRKFT